PFHPVCHRRGASDRFPSAKGQLLFHAGRCGQFISQQSSSFNRQVVPWRSKLGTSRSESVVSSPESQPLRRQNTLLHVLNGTAEIGRIGLQARIKLMKRVSPVSSLWLM